MGAVRGEGVKEVMGGSGERRGEVRDLFWHWYEVLKDFVVSNCYSSTFICEEPALFRNRVYEILLKIYIDRRHNLICVLPRSKFQKPRDGHVVDVVDISE